MVETCCSHEGNPIRDASGGPEYPTKEAIKQPELGTCCGEDGCDMVAHRQVWTPSFGGWRLT